MLDLIRRYQAGESNAAWELAEALRPEIRKAAKPLAPSMGVEDALAESQAALIAVAKRFDADGYISSSTPLSFALYRNIQDALRPQQRKVIKAAESEVPMTATHERSMVAASMSELPRQTPKKKTPAPEALAQLSPLQRQVYDLSEQGKNSTAIGAALKIKPDYARKTLERARKILESWKQKKSVTPVTPPKLDVDSSLETQDTARKKALQVLTKEQLLALEALGVRLVLAPEKP